MDREAKKKRSPDFKLEFEQGWSQFSPRLFQPMRRWIHVRGHEDPHPCPRDGHAAVAPNGMLFPNPRLRLARGVWAYVYAHCLLHLALGHFQKRPRMREWQAACDCVVTRLLLHLKVGVAPILLPAQEEIPNGSEEQLYQRFCLQGIPPELAGLGMAGEQGGDMLGEPWVKYGFNSNTEGFDKLFAEGLAEALDEVVRSSAEAPFLHSEIKLTNARKAQRWLINQFPLLGALAAEFALIEDRDLGYRMGISVAAVDEVLREIYVNPAAHLTEPECRFVLAHELLHADLRHLARRQGRDPFLWNVACDYVVNGWLIEMGIGQTPASALHDPALKGFSAEAAYDRIVLDLRRYRSLATLAGAGVADMLERCAGAGSEQAGMSLDEFYCSALMQGLVHHQQHGRGTLPAGLVEDIRALGHPPIPWDVALAQWFDEQFPPIDKRRSYARPSRRQAATPDIPRPRWVTPEEAKEGRTFGVVLDTSGSMDRLLLGKALGAIASYSAARDVPAARVVFCDARAYDQGYLPPEAIAGRVKVKGRGGTVLQPGIDLLEAAKDFPKNGPILIITDGECDALRVCREHAFLVPAGARLPFTARGRVFRVR